MQGPSSASDATGEPTQVALQPGPATSFDAQLSHLYEQYFDFTWRSLKRLGVTESQLDDATQEVFLVVLRRLPEFEGRSKISTWIFRTAMNVAMHARRAQARSRLDFPDTMPEATAPGDSPEDRLANADEAALVRHLLDQLDLDHRAVLILAEFEDQSPAAISEMLGIPRNTVYSRLRAARNSFADHYRRFTANASTRRRHA